MVKIENGYKMPKVRRPRGSVPASVEKAYNEYAKAYRDVYGITAPPYSYNAETRYVNVQGIGEFNVKILRERTKSLIYRKG